MRHNAIYAGPWKKGKASGSHERVLVNGGRLVVVPRTQKRGHLFLHFDGRGHVVSFGRYHYKADAMSRASDSAQANR